MAGRSTIAENIDGQLARIDKKLDGIAKTQGEMQIELGRIETSQGTIIERSREDRDRLKILEGSMSKVWGEVGKVQDRQKGWAAVQATVAAAFAAIAAWLGMQK